MKYLLAAKIWIARFFQISQKCPFELYGSISKVLHIYQLLSEVTTKGVEYKNGTSSKLPYSKNILNFYPIQLIFKQYFLPMV